MTGTLATSPRSAPDRAASQAVMRVCFSCEGDPSRAFIAEALVRDVSRGAADGRAEGDPAALHPLARAVMSEVGLPLRETRQPPSSDEVPEVLVHIRNRGTAAGPREGACLPWSFDDPAQASEAERRQAFRRVRDEIKRRLDLLLLVKRVGAGCRRR